MTSSGPLVTAMPQRPVTLYASGSVTLTASGVSADFDTSDVSLALLVVFVGGAVTGTTPSLVVTLEVQDANGNWITTVQTTALTTGPNYTTANAGGTAGSTPMLTGRARVRWTVTGTTPSFPSVGISLQGR